MKSHLSYILPVWKASEILGEPVVRRMVASLLHLRHTSAANRAFVGETTTTGNPLHQNHNNSLEHDIELLTKALFYHTDEDKDSTAVPSEIAHAWKRWLNARNLALDKATLIQFVVPHTVQPHAGPSGHMGLFDCWVYALQGHAMTSATTYYGGANNTLITLPDVIILLAAAHNYCTWTEGGNNLLIKKRGEGGSDGDEDFSERSAVTEEDGMELQNHANSSSFDSQEVAAAENAAAQVIRQPPSTKTTTEASNTEPPTLSPRSRNKKLAVAEALKARQEIDGMHQSMVDEALDATTTIQPSNSQESAASKGFSWRRFQYESQEAVRAMALLAFRLYDAYQKKGAVARDTVHRFLTDVHGEDSYKESPTKELLDTMFADPSLSDTAEAPVVESLQMTVSESTFVARIIESFDYERRTHLLLDWMAHLIDSMVPLEEMPASVTAYLETMERRPKPLCEVYRIAEGRLFEVKRRFHSLVRSGPSVIQGDPMGGGETAAEQQQQQTNQSQQSTYPQQTIRQSTFVEAVTSTNEEMGHGGYLPPSLAELVFQAGSQNMAGEASAVFVGSIQSGKASSSSASSAEEEAAWTLPNLLQFGCTAVRQSNASQKSKVHDVAILKFLFQVFALDHQKDSDVEKNAAVDESSSSSEPKKLTRSQIERMILLMVEHMSFRLHAESPTSGGASEKKKSWSKLFSAPKKDADDGMLDLEPTYLLGLLPPKMDRSDSKKATLVKLTKLVDYALEYTADGANMSFEEFCEWNAAAPDGGPRSRLSSLIFDLQLIASVLFGIPPTFASLEVSLIAEIERRHKARYPQTNVSRRGPRGTIWHIIDAEWLRKWAHAVKELADTDQDGVDGRDQPKGAVRGLGRIENANLMFNGTLALRQDIQWKHDYEILPPMAWQAMQAWYDGGPPIYRGVVRYIDNSKQANKERPANSKSRMPTENEIELYPYFVTVYLCDSQSGGESRPFQQNYQLSRVSPIGIMLDQLCKELEVDPAMARLWVLGTGSDSSIAGDEPMQDWILNREENIVDQRKKRLDPSQIKKDIQLLLELKDRESGQWPRGEDGKSWVDRRSTDGKNIQEENLGDGIVGLYNMGNTCFLNSSIQCISHTPIFREYFTSKAYLNDINTTNPLGHQGQLAQVSAVLINSLWKPYHHSALSSNTKRITAPGSYAMVQTQSLTPKTFKDSLGKFNELFAGNEQHDAQELLTFLLAGLSEDLNRIVDKPYIEAPDSDGRPDKELADIWWSNHLQRELSIVVALFNGQYKNLLTCRTCKYESARFEPFSTLTVPLPEDDSLRASIILYPYSETKEPTKYCVRVRGSGNLGDVLIELAKLILKDEGVDIDDVELNEEEDVADKTGEDESEERIVGLDPKVVQKAKDLSIVDMRDSYIFRIAPLTWQLHDLQNKDTGDLPIMHAYELGELQDVAALSTENDGEDKPKSKSGYLAISQRRSDLLSRDYLHPLSHKLFGTPILLRLSEIESCTGRELYDTVAKRLRPLVPKGALRFLESKTEGIMSSSTPSESEGDSSCMTRSPTDAETVSAGPVPRYGFRLRVTSRDGRKCLVCPWYKCCVGCLINDNNSVASVMDGDSLVVDWHFAVDVATLGFGARSCLLDPIASRPNPGTRLLKPSPVTVKSHPSCGIGGKGSHAGAITLESCLEAFAKEERIPEAYCSKCKEFRVQTTRMTLWRLPPVLIIHLKRFQFTSTMRRKLRDLVVFPLEGLDLSCIMEQDGSQSSGVNRATKGSESKDSETDDSTEATSSSDKQLYDLYGVIHHQGALSGGHYVASLKSEIDGQWRLFNDAQVYEIHARDVIDASAYILFYMRRDVAENARLSDFWDLKQVATLNEEEMENLVKGKSDRCTIQ